MQSAKQEAKTMIDGLLEDASFEDIQYHLYVLEKFNAGIESIETQGGISHEEAKNRFEKWLKD